MSDKRSVLIINRTSPYGSSLPREAFDVALTCSIFETPVSLLFISDGVYQLLNEQKPENLGQKNLQSILASLPMYDIENIYVASDDLPKRGLTEQDLSLSVEALDSDAIKALINSHDSVLTF